MDTNSRQRSGQVDCRTDVKLVFPKIEPYLAYKESDMLQIGVCSRWLLLRYINVET